MSVLYQGSAVDAEWTQLRGLHYGDGVFRTMLCWQGDVVDWPSHYRKLAEDAARLNLEVPSNECLWADLRQLIGDAAPNCAIKLWLCRAPTARGYAPSTRQSRRLLSVSALPPHPADCWSHGIEAGISAVRVSRQPLLAGIKHLNRLEQVMASDGWPPSWREALMCDDRDHLICGTRSNLFFVTRNGRLLTPDVSESGVAGITRSRILGLAADLGMAGDVRQIARDELGEMAECFVCNALIGIWPVARLDSRPLPAPGPVTEQLMQRLSHPWRGQT